MRLTSVFRLQFLRKILSGLLAMALALGVYLAAPILRRTTATTHAQTTIVRCRTQAPAVGVAMDTTLYIEVVDVTNLFGYQLKLQYDPALVALLDGDASRDGVNFTLGSFLSPDFVHTNIISDTIGIGSLVMTEIAPTPPKSGDGELLRVTLRGQAEGTANFSLQSIILSDHGGNAIPYEVENCSLVIRPSQFLPLVLKQ